MASWKLALLRNALKAATLPRGAIRDLSARSLSTGVFGEQDSSSSSSSSASSEPFINPPNEGLVFAKVTNIGRNTLKTDVINYFEGCNLSVDDLKVAYNHFYNPLAMLMQFSSRSSYDTALRQIMRKGRLYNLMKIDRSQWDLQINYNGKTVVVRPPRNALMEDIERMFAGCNLDASEIVSKQGVNGPLKLVLLRFPTRSAAMTAVCQKNRSFCLNMAVTMHLLE